MPSKAIKILTIFLFSGLVVVFVAYKSGYLSLQNSESDQNQIQAETVDGKSLPNPELDIDFSDSALMMAFSSKSMVAIDETPLAKTLEEVLKKGRKSSPLPNNGDDSIDINDRLLASTKVIIPTDKGDLASEFRDFFRKTDKPILVTTNRLNLEKDDRFDSPPKISLDGLPNSLLLPNTGSSTLTPTFSIHNQLASTSKSIVVANHSALATDMKLSFNQYWRKIFAPYNQSIDSALINQDSVSQQMLAKIDSLTKSQRMLMLSSKSGISIDQTYLADSLISLWKTALKLRLDSLSKENKR